MTCIARIRHYTVASSCLEDIAQQHPGIGRAHTFETSSSACSCVVMCLAHERCKVDFDWRYSDASLTSKCLININKFLQSSL